jgi:hypothetical protein
MISRANPEASIKGRVAAAAIALLVAVGLTLAPPIAGPAVAASGRLLVSSASVYTVDIEAAAVHVSDVVSLHLVCAARRDPDPRP